MVWAKMPPPPPPPLVGYRLTVLIVDGDFCSLLDLLLMNANSHFVTSKYSLIMCTVLFTYVAYNLNSKNKTFLNCLCSLQHPMRLIELLLNCRVYPIDCLEGSFYVWCALCNETWLKFLKAFCLFLSAFGTLVSSITLTKDNMAILDEK